MKRFFILLNWRRRRSLCRRMWRPRNRLASKIIGVTWPRSCGCCNWCWGSSSQVNWTEELPCSISVLSRLTFLVPMLWNFRGPRNVAIFLRWISPSAISCLRRWRWVVPMLWNFFWILSPVLPLTIVSRYRRQWCIESTIPLQTEFQDERIQQSTDESSTFFHNK